MLERSSDWQRFNQEYLMAAVSKIRKLLEAKAGKETRATEAISVLSETPSALDQLASIFGLSTFERDILLLCAVNLHSD